MRWLIVNADYPAFLRWLYATDHALGDAPYDAQMRARNATMFGTADFYSTELRRLGHEAADVHFNMINPKTGARVKHQLHHGGSERAGQTSNGAERVALNEQVENSDLLFARQDVHGESAFRGCGGFARLRLWGWSLA